MDALPGSISGFHATLIHARRAGRNAVLFRGGTVMRCSLDRDRRGRHQLLDIDETAAPRPARGRGAPDLGAPVFRSGDACTNDYANTQRTTATGERYAARHENNTTIYADPDRHHINAPTHACGARSDDVNPHLGGAGTECGSATGWCGYLSARQGGDTWFAGGLQSAMRTSAVRAELPPIRRLERPPRRWGAAEVPPPLFRRRGVTHATALFLAAFSVGLVAPAALARPAAGSRASLPHRLSGPGSGAGAADRGLVPGASPAPRRHRRNGTRTPNIVRVCAGVWFSPRRTSPDAKAT